MTIRAFTGSFLVTTALAAGLAGCSSDPRTQAIISQTFDFGKSAPESADPAFLAAYEADAPAVAAVVESRPDTIAVALRQARSDSSGVETMIAADGSQLMFDRGVLVGSRGFGNDLMASEVTESGALIHGLGTGTATRLMTFLDGNDNAVTRAFKCTVSPGDSASVTIGTTPVAARIVTEHCRGALADFFNYYWVVPGSGEIIQSSQWAGPLTRSISVRKMPSVRS